MKVILEKYSLGDQEGVRELCNGVDRSYIANRLPSPYTKEDAIWWINMVNENDGKNGIFRLITVNDKIVGSISVEQKSDVFGKDDAWVEYFEKELPALGFTPDIGHGRYFEFYTKEGSCKYKGIGENVNG